MGVVHLDKKDQTLLRRCLTFASTTPLLDGEFSTRIGTSKAEFDAMLARWPEAGDVSDDSAATVAINNALNEIVHGLSLSARDLTTIGSSRGAIQALYFRWAQTHGWSAQDLR